MSKAILVTGACGFTGSHMIEHLAEHRPEAKIVATDLPGSQRSEYYVEAPDSDAPQPVYYEDIHTEYNVEFIPADLTKKGEVEEVISGHEYDEVYHIASLFDYFAQRDALYAVNVDGTQHLLSALATQDSRCRLIHWSTLGVLGDAGFENPKTEESAYNPHNRYCESKVVQEQVVQAFSNSLDITIIRPAPIYGPRHQYGVYHILKLLAQLGFAPVARLYPRSRQLKFPCIHVRDVVRCATYLADRPEAVGERYNLLSDPIGQDELLSFLASELSLRKVVLPTPYHVYALLATGVYPLFKQSEKIARRRQRRPLIDAPMIRYLTANMWFANEKLKSTGFEFIYEDPRDGLTEYIGWCQQHGYLDRPTSKTEKQVDRKQQELEGKLQEGPAHILEMPAVETPVDPQEISPTVDPVTAKEKTDESESLLRRVIARV